METRLLIAGELVAGDGAPLSVENPFTEQEVASLAAASDAQIDAAVGAAREATTTWGRLPAGERGELLKEVAAGLRERSDELAELMTREGGKSVGPRRRSITTPRSVVRARAP
jgi:acyl-CoA reductase-like NAD-dependent aldehyde dehydrogenase